VQLTDQLFFADRIRQEFRRFSGEAHPERRLFLLKRAEAILAKDAVM